MQGESIQRGKWGGPKRAGRFEAAGSALIWVFLVFAASSSFDGQRTPPEGQATIDRQLLDLMSEVRLLIDHWDEIDMYGVGLLFHVHYFFKGQVQSGDMMELSCMCLTDLCKAIGRYHGKSKSRNLKIEKRSNWMRINFLSFATAF